jgi:shikimate dehydrogenase
MSADIDRYFVLGNPVAHSCSPFIHARFAEQTGERLHYERRLCSMEGFAAAVRALAADRDGGPVRGCNVTIPFKFETPALAGRVTPRAQLAGAANVLRFDRQDSAGWLADNTDGIGLLRDIELHAGVALQGQRVLLIGAGGGAAGVLGPLIEAAPALIRVINRSPARAGELVARHAAAAESHSVALAAGGLDAPGAAYDIVINASASSLSGTAAPVGPAVLRRGCLAIDLMYGPAAGPFVAWARAHGAQARDGLGMLVEQAAEAFALWRGRRPQTLPVLAALRRELGQV